MSSAGPLERRLFRLCLAFKFLFWCGCLGLLAQGIWTVASRREPELPMGVVWAIGVLAVLQLGTWFGWFLLRRARLREGRP